MNAFVVAAVAMLLAGVPAARALRRGTLMDAVVVYELIAAVVVMVLLLLAQGFGRSGEFELSVLLGVLMLASGLVFVRSLERWL
jgi:multisubunit Na+/H+ antiporter MnhF subunit